MSKSVRLHKAGTSDSILTEENGQKWVLSVQYPSFNKPCLISFGQWTASNWEASKVRQTKARKPVCLASYIGKIALSYINGQASSWQQEKCDSAYAKGEVLALGSNNGPIILLLLWSVLAFWKICRGRGLIIILWVFDWDTDISIEREVLFKGRAEQGKQCGTCGQAGKMTPYIPGILYLGTATGWAQ